MARPSLTRHRKFLRLARTLGSAPLALGCLELLWEKSYENGDPYLGDALDVEVAAQWKGESGVLCNALLSAGGDGNQGFIEEVDGRPGHFQVHDLFQHAPRYVGKRLERELRRKANGLTLSQIRADAGRRGAAATNAKRSAKDTNCSANEQQFGGTPAPAPKGETTPANEQQFADTNLGCTPTGTPEGLTTIEYARMMLESLGLPATGNIHLVADAIGADAKKRALPESQAFDQILAAAVKDQNEGVEINRFYWTDAKFRRNSHAQKNAQGCYREIETRAESAARLACEKGGLA